MGNRLIDKVDEIVATEDVEREFKSIQGKERGPQFEEEGNQATAEQWSRSPRTLDEMLTECKVDLTIWQVERFVCNKWEQGAKVGTRDNPRVQITPLYQIKVWLLRKVAVQTDIPPIQPILIKATVLRRPMPVRAVKKAIVFPDIQCGFKRDHRTGVLSPLHDRRALDVALQICRHAQPDKVVFLGDDLDLPEWSNKFLVSPEFYFTTQAAVVELAWHYGQVRAIAPNAEIHKIAGNHDERFLIAVKSNLRAAYDLRPADDLDGHALLSMERLLGLDSLGIEYCGPYPLGETWINSNLRAHHGEVVRGQSGKTTAAVANDLRHSEMFGHIHRIEMAAKTGWSKEGPKVYSAWSFGTLASIAPGVVPGFKSHQNWQQGLGEVDYEEGNGFFNITPVIIYDGVAIYNGKRFEARSEEEIVAHIEQDTKYNLRAA